MRTSLYTMWMLDSAEGRQTNTKNKKILIIETFCFQDVCYKVRVPNNDKRRDMAEMNLQDYTKAVDTYADSAYRVAYSYTYTKD